MHESTISRVTSGKYMHTPRGVFEMRYFFSSQVEGRDGSGTSSTAIRAKIRKLIKEEDPEAPLSDGRIAELLSGEGIPVARRTVAKYREAMGIAPRTNGGAQERSRCHGFKVNSTERAVTKGDGSCSLTSPVTTSKSRAPLRSYVEKKLERMVRHFDHVIDVHCVLTVEKLQQKAEATLHVSGETDPRRCDRGRTCTPPSTR